MESESGEASIQQTPTIQGSKFAAKDRVKFTKWHIDKWKEREPRVETRVGTITRVYMLGKYPIARVLWDDECGPDDFPHEISFDILDKIEPSKVDTSDDWFKEF